MKGQLLSDDDLIHVNGGQSAGGNLVYATLGLLEDPRMLLSDAKLPCASSLNEASKSLLEGVIIPHMKQFSYQNLKLEISNTFNGSQIKAWEAN